VNELSVEIIPSDLGFKEGISCIRIGHVLSAEIKDCVIAGSNGILKIARWITDQRQWVIQQEFDLTENGGLWNIELGDINGDHLDEIIVGGIQGAVVVLSGRGEEIWSQQFTGAITGLKIWPHNALQDHNGSSRLPRIIVFSLDKTLRVFDHTGKLLWAQMFSDGVSTVDIADCDQDGKEEVIAGGNDGTLRIFDGENGKIKWFKELGANIRAILCINTKIICGGDDRKISLFDGLSQQFLQSRSFPAYIWFIRRNADSFDSFIATTFSFQFLGEGADDSHDPSFGIYRLSDLNIIDEISQLNCQDFLISTHTLLPSQRIGIIGETNGALRFVELENALKSLTSSIPHLPSTINSIQLFAESILAGCDDGKLYQVRLKDEIIKS